MHELQNHIECLREMNERLQAVKLALACRDFERRVTRQEQVWRREHPPGFVPLAVAAQGEAARPPAGA